MSKYIIELDDDVQIITSFGAEDGTVLMRQYDGADLEELNSDYINEHFGELQNDAYQRGYEAALKMIKKIYEDPTAVKLSMSEMESLVAVFKEQQNVIRPGDEVEDVEGDRYVITKISADNFSAIYANGEVLDGLPRGIIKRKTGRHFAIAQLLKEMGDVDRDV